MKQVVKKKKPSGSGNRKRKAEQTEENKVLSERHFCLTNSSGSGVASSASSSSTVTCSSSTATITDAVKATEIEVKLLSSSEKQDLLFCDADTNSSTGRGRKFIGPGYCIHLSTNLCIVFAVCYSRNQLITQDLLLKMMLVLTNGENQKKFYPTRKVQITVLNFVYGKKQN